MRGVDGINYGTWERHASELKCRDALPCDFAVGVGLRPPSASDPVCQRPTVSRLRANKSYKDTCHSIYFHLIHTGGSIRSM